jgi:phage terminase large subunit GpA-like protein
VTTPGPGYCRFPIAYQQEFFNQLTSEEVRTRFVRGHPVR